MAALGASKPSQQNIVFQGITFFVQLDPQLDVNIDTAGTRGLKQLIESLGGAIVDDLRTADYCVLQHRKQPEHSAAVGAYRKCVSVPWLLASLQAGGPVPLGPRAFSPFPLAALATPTTLRMCTTGFAGKERSLLLLLARCTGAEVTREMKIGRRAEHCVLLAKDVFDQSLKVREARKHPDKVDVLNTLWLLDSLVEGRLQPRDKYRGAGEIMEALAAVVSEAMHSGHSGQGADASGPAGGESGTDAVVPDSEDDTPGLPEAGAVAELPQGIAGAGDCAAGIDGTAAGTAAIGPAGVPRSTPPAIPETATAGSSGEGRYQAGPSIEPLPPVAEDREDALAEAPAGVGVETAKVHAGAAVPQQDGADEESPSQRDRLQQAEGDRSVAGAAAAQAVAPEFPPPSEYSGPPGGESGRLGATQAMGLVGALVADLGTAEDLPLNNFDAAPLPAAGTAGAAGGAVPASAAQEGPEQQATTSAEYFTAPQAGQPARGSTAPAFFSADPGSTAGPAAGAAAATGGRNVESPGAEPALAAAAAAAAAGGQGGHEAHAAAVPVDLEETLPVGGAFLEGSETEADEDDLPPLQQLLQNHSPPPTAAPSPEPAAAADLGGLEPEAPPAVAGAGGVTAVAVTAEDETASLEAASPAATEQIGGSASEDGGGQHAQQGQRGDSAVSGGASVGAGDAGSPDAEMDELLEGEEEGEEEESEDDEDVDDSGAAFEDAPEELPASEAAGHAAAAVADAPVAAEPAADVAEPVQEEAEAAEAASPRAAAAAAVAQAPAGVPSGRDVSPPVPPQQQAGVAAGVARRAVTRSRSKSATPNGSGSGGRKRKQPAPERAMFSQQLPEADELELRSLQRMRVNDGKAAAAATKAKAKAVRAGRPSDGVEAAPPLRRKGSRLGQQQQQQQQQQQGKQQEQGQAQAGREGKLPPGDAGMADAEAEAPPVQSPQQQRRRRQQGTQPAGGGAASPPPARKRGRASGRSKSAAEPEAAVEPLKESAGDGAGSPAGELEHMQEAAQPPARSTRQDVVKQQKQQQQHAEKQQQQHTEKQQQQHAEKQQQQQPQGSKALPAPAATAAEEKATGGRRGGSRRAAQQPAPVAEVQAPAVEEEVEEEAAAAAAKPSKRGRKAAAGAAPPGEPTGTKDGQQRTDAQQQQDRQEEKEQQDVAPSGKRGRGAAPLPDAGATEQSVEQAERGSKASGRGAARKGRAAAAAEAEQEPPPAGGAAPAAAAARRGRSLGRQQAAPEPMALAAPGNKGKAPAKTPAQPSGGKRSAAAGRTKRQQQGQQEEEGGDAGVEAMELEQPSPPAAAPVRASARKRKTGGLEEQPQGTAEAADAAAEEEGAAAAPAKRQRTAAGRAAKGAAKQPAAKAATAAGGKAAAKAAAPVEGKQSGRGRRSATPAAAGTAGAAGAAGAAGTLGGTPGRTRSVVVALSGMHRPEQRELAAKIENLKVKCTMGTEDGHAWDPTVTHVVSEKPRRNQKCLAVMAAGGWLVGPGWVEACAQAGELVPEAPHELGKAEAEVERGAAPHWRRRAAATGAGAFEGLRCHVVQVLNKPFHREDIVNIIKAGGGKLVPASAADMDLAVACTETAEGDSRLAALAKRGVLVAGPLYVVEWVAKYKSSLARHALLGSKPGPRLAAAAAARSTMGAPAGASKAGPGSSARASGELEQPGEGRDSDNESELSVLFD